jgi:hypothetical protein
MEYDGGSRTRNENWINWIERASQQINVTADTVSREALLEARNAVESAAVICFLGFGYNRTNLERLDMPNTLNKFRPRLFGSAVAMTKASRDAVEHWIPGLELARQAENCVKTLEELPVIREI